MRDISIRQQYEADRSHFRSTPDTSKSPLLKQNSVISYSPLMGDPEVSKVIPKPLPPPSLASITDEVKRRSVSPERKLLGTYDTREIVSQLIMKNHEDAHKQAWLTLKNTESEERPKSSYAEISELLSTGKSNAVREAPKKVNLYDELLKKKYGVIRPRLVK